MNMIILASVLLTQHAHKQVSKTLTLTASVYGPGADRHASRNDRVAWHPPGSRGDLRIKDVPVMSVACNQFPLGAWLYVTYHKKSLLVMNADYCGTPPRIDFLLPVWDYLTDVKRPLGLLKGVVVRKATKEEIEEGTKKKTK